MPSFDATPAGSLTQSSVALPDGRICHAYHYGGRDWRVIDDAENILLVIRLFADDELGPDEKAAILIQMLFPEPEKAVEVAGDGLWGLVTHVLWEAAGLDVDGSHADVWEDGSPCFDWEEDAERIKATLLGSYGVSWDEAKRKVTYKELCSLLGMAPPDSPFGLAVHYRTAEEPQASRYNEDELRRFRKAKAFYALKGGEARLGGVERQAAQAGDTFAALKRRATA